MTFTLRLFIVFLIAAITRLLLLYFFPVHLTDYHLIETAADNLTNGYGMGFQRASVQDLSHFYFEGLRLWPPLITLVTALMNHLTGNPLLANFILISVSMLGTLWIVYKLTKTISLNENWSLVLFAFLALNPEVIKQPGLSDVISVFFCLWAILIAIEWIQTSETKTVFQLISISFLFFLPSAFRYQYYPVSIIFPVAILFYGLNTKNKRLTKASLTCLTLVAIFILLQEVLIYSYTGQTITAPVQQDNSGIYPRNLLETYPFFPKTFANTSYLENTWQHFFLPHRYHYFLLAFLLFCVWCCLLIKKLSTSKTIEPSRNFTIGFILSVLLFIILTLAALSLTNQSQQNVHGNWTFLMEGRYFIVPSILLLLLSLWLMQQYYSQKQKRIQKLIQLILSLVLLYNGILTIKFYYNIANRNIPSQKPEGESERTLIGDFLQKKANESTIPLVICTEDPSVGFYPHHKNIAVTESGIKSLSSNTIRTTKAVNLCLIVVKNKGLYTNELSLETKAKTLYQTKNYQIYSIHIEPHQQLKLLD